MIKKALFDYLTYHDDLSGAHDTDLFANPITLDDNTVTNRNEARRYLRDIIGHHFYAGRMKEKGDMAVIIREISGSPDYHLKGIERENAILQTDIVARNHNAETRIETAAVLLKASMSGYHGQWSITTPADIHSCMLTRSSDIPVAPKGGETYWTFRKSMDWTIAYSFANVEYPIEELGGEILVT